MFWKIHKIHQENITQKIKQCKINYPGSVAFYDTCIISCHIITNFLDEKIHLILADDDVSIIMLL